MRKLLTFFVALLPITGIVAQKSTLNCTFTGLDNSTKVLVCEPQGNRLVPSDTLTIDVKGASKAKYVSAVVLDNTRDIFPCEVGWRDGRLTLVKPDKNSAAFFITFE